jgi:hypothetical protein
MKYFKKRGSQAGIMISFVLFILFLLSIFLLISPLLKERGQKQPILYSLYQKLSENVSSNMTLTLIKIEEAYNSGGKTCLKLSGGGWKSGENIAVKNINNERIDSNFNYPELEVNWAEGDKFLKIYSSPENFESMPLSPNDCATPVEDSNFFIKSIKTEKYIFESNIVKLRTMYNSSYETLKSYLDIPLEEEFGFSFINSTGGTVIEVGKIPASVSVYSKENYVVYVDNQSNIFPGVIIVKVW